MKPLRKSVTAQDIQSSLYYVHLDNLEDERLKEYLIASSEKHASTSGIDGPKSPSVENNFIQRRPVASKPNLACDHNTFNPSSENSYFESTAVTQRFSSRVQGTSVEKTSGTVYNDPDLPPTRPDRHLVGPRAMQPRRYQEKTIAPGLSAGKENKSLRQRSKQPPTQELSSSKLGHTNKHGENRRSLTLIRRYNGLQSNVGKIQNLSPSGLPLNMPLHQQSDEISIEISTPGYAPLNTTQGDQFGQDKVFERRLFQRGKRPNSSDGSHLNKSSRSSFNSRRSSEQEYHPGIDTKTSPVLPPERKATSPKRYMFHSPWNGHCEFSTSFAGGSLKCKHITQTGSSQSLPVSELRFNFPHSLSLGPPSPKSPALSPEKPRHVKRSSYFSSRHSRHLSVPGAAKNGKFERDSLHDGEEEEEEEEEEERLDLSLGQERSGGGFEGKKAKLGKLIIEKEGLKMLDLIVAANIGLWWKAYEKLL